MMMSWSYLKNFLGGSDMMKKVLIIGAVLLLGLVGMLTAQRGMGSKGGDRSSPDGGKGRQEQRSSPEIQSLTGILEKSVPLYVLHSDQDYYLLGFPDFLEELPWETGSLVTVEGKIIQDATLLGGPLMDVLQKMDSNNRLIILTSVMIGDELFEAPMTGREG
jgi:hypothetical protein